MMTDTAAPPAPQPQQVDQQQLNADLARLNSLASEEEAKLTEQQQADAANAGTTDTTADPAAQVQPSPVAGIKREALARFGWETFGRIFNGLELSAGEIAALAEDTVPVLDEMLPGAEMTPTAKLLTTAVTIIGAKVFLDGKPWRKPPIEQAAEQQQDDEGNNDGEADGA